MENNNEKKGIWSKIKGFFLIVGALIVSIKGTAALPAEHLVDNMHKDKMKQIEEVKTQSQEKEEKKKPFYPEVKHPTTLKYSSQLKNVKIPGGKGW